MHTETRGRLFYLHIPKNSGSTLKNILKRNYHRIYSVSWDELAEDYYGKLLERSDPACFDGYDAVSGHYPYGLHRICAPECKYRYLTMLRAPVARALSAYNYLRNDSTYIHAHAELAEYLSRIDVVQFSTEYHPKLPNHIYVDNGQVRYLSGVGDSKPFGAIGDSELGQAKQNLETMIFGLTEQFDRSMVYFRDQLGWRTILYTKSKVGRKSAAKITDDELRAIEYANRFDCQLYEFAVERFGEQAAYISERELRTYARRLALYQKVDRIAQKGVAALKRLTGR